MCTCARAHAMGSTVHRFTVSTFDAEIHRGMSSALCVHFSGWSVFKQAAQTRENWMVSKSGEPSAAFIVIICVVTKKATNG